MSDWIMYELEDILWDEFGESDDHIVPHPSSEQGDSDKKPCHEAANAAGRSPDNKKLGYSFHRKDECPPALNNSPPDGEIAAFRPGSSQDAETENNLCHFSLGGFSPADSDLVFVGNKEDKDSSNHLDYGWLDIGNFEDVDRMFRNCDSTFGQGDISISEELILDSSSSQFAGCKDVKSVFRHSSSERSVTKRKSKPYDANTGFIPCENPPEFTECDKKTECGTFPTGSWTPDRDEPSRINYCTRTDHLDADSENKGKSARKEQPLECDESEELKMPSQSQTGSEGSLMSHHETDTINAQRKLSKSRHQSGGNKGQPPDHLSGTSLTGTSPIKQISSLNLPISMTPSLPVFPSPVIAQTKQFWVHFPYMPVGYSYPLYQIPVTPTLPSISNPVQSHRISAHSLYRTKSLESSREPPSKASFATQEKIKKIRKHKKMRAAFTIEHQQQHFLCQSVFTDGHQIPNQPRNIQDEVAVDNEVDGRSVEFSAVEVDSSTSQESSFMSSMLSDELSPKENSFCQLQDIMAQLDIRTKLCIRDGLYRLARSAKQRHKSSCMNSSCTYVRKRNGAYDRLQSNSCAGSTNVETDTNPIDRSIAHLLFHRPADSYSTPAIDALSLESKIINQCCIASQPAIPDRQPCPQDVSGGLDT